MKKSTLFLAAILSLAHHTFSQSTVKPAPLAEQAPKMKPGLTLTFTADGKSDTRDARILALHVPAGAAVTPFLPAGAFGAKWEGEIVSPLRSEYTIGAEVRGALKLTINGNPVLEGAGDTTSQPMNKTLQLNKGGNKIVAEFSSDGKQDAFLQITWSSNEFPPEPIPPTAFTHNISAPDLREGQRTREGRMLFAQMRCAACHSDATLIPPRSEGMPELAQDAPVFADLGAKFNEAWLAQWIGDPHSIRPHSLMPRVFPADAEGKIDPRARDLAAYFVSQGKRDDTAPSGDLAPQGGALFANLGCISCHTAPDFQGQDEFDRVPLSHTKAKWQPPALLAYLKDPAKNYASSRMPHFRLSDEEAAQIGAYLLSGTQREFPAGPAGDASKGAQMLVTAGCLNCHAGMPPTTQSTLAATLKNGWVKGCVSDDAAGRGAAPDFALSANQRDALRAFAANGLPSLKQDSPIEVAERQMKNLRCTACHARDGQASVWSQLDSEIATLTAAAPTEPTEGHPIAGAVAPMLTWAGEKLRPEWMEKFIAGHVAYKPRHYQLARMPGFALAAKGIAEGLSHEHGFALQIPKEPAPAEDIVKAGEQLVSENGGFNCTTCHTLADRPATAVFEAPAPNFSYTRERLRKGYYMRWVMAPLRIDPETKMPRFADDEGNTPLSEILGGKAAAQFDAIWQYFGTVPMPK